MKTRSLIGSQRYSLAMLIVFAIATTPLFGQEQPPAKAEPAADKPAVEIPAEEKPFWDSAQTFVDAYDVVRCCELQKVANFQV